MIAQRGEITDAAVLQRAGEQHRVVISSCAAAKPLGFPSGTALAGVNAASTLTAAADKAITILCMSILP